MLETVISTAQHKNYASNLRKGAFHTHPIVWTENHNLSIEQQMELKLFLAIKLCWHFLLTKFQVSSLCQLKVMNQVGKLDVCVEDPLPFLQIWSHIQSWLRMDIFPIQAKVYALDKFTVTTSSVIMWLAAYILCRYLVS